MRAAAHRSWLLASRRAPPPAPTAGHTPRTSASGLAHPGQQGASLNLQPRRSPRPAPAGLLTSSKVEVAGENGPNSWSHGTGRCASRHRDPGAFPCSIDFGAPWKGPSMTSSPQPPCLLQSHHLLGSWLCYSPREKRLTVQGSPPPGSGAESLSALMTVPPAVLDFQRWSSSGPRQPRVCVRFPFSLCGYFAPGMAAFSSCMVTVSLSAGSFVIVNKRASKHVNKPTCLS